MWTVVNKKVDLGEPTSFIDHENLGCTQRQCEISTDIVDNYRNMFESQISAGGTLAKNIASTTTCPTDRPNGRGSVLKVGTPDPDVEKEQEAIEYVDHELLTNRFHVTHYGGCAVL